jgi:hypothetical protein
MTKENAIDAGLFSEKELGMSGGANKFQDETFSARDGALRAENDIPSSFSLNNP